MKARTLVGHRVVLLSCGSFNPPTYLHLRLFERARDFLQKDCHCTVLEGLISPVSDYFRVKKPTLAPAEHRLRMVQLATEGSEWIRADGWECGLPKWTRTVEVLRHHRAQLIQKYGEERFRLVLLCGGDTVDSFTRPDPNGPSGRLWQQEHLIEILSQFGLVVVDRLGAKAAETLKSPELGFLHPLLNDFVSVIEENVFPNDMSSTRLRNAIRCGASIRYCTPDPVVDYIQLNGLYTPEWEQRRRQELAAENHQPGKEEERRNN